MPGSATLTTEQAVLGHTLGFSTMTKTTTAYIGLCAAAPAPTATTGGSELAGNAYARQAVTFALASSPPNIAANVAAIVFPIATPGNWGAVGYFELWTAATGGTRLYWGPLVDPVDGVTPISRNVLAGDSVRFQPGVIEVQAT